MSKKETESFPVEAPKDLLTAFDEAWKSMFSSRSECIRHLMRDFVEAVKTGKKEA